MKKRETKKIFSEQTRKLDYKQQWENNIVTWRSYLQCGSWTGFKSKEGQARHTQLLCADNHINKMDFIPVQFVTAKGTLHYVRTEGTDGTGYHDLFPQWYRNTLKIKFQKKYGIRFTLRNGTVKKLPTPMQGTIKHTISFIVFPLHISKIQVK
jgi:hypothetical protein